MRIQDSEYTYFALRTDVISHVQAALLQALVSLKRDEFASDDEKVRRAEFVIASILNDASDVQEVPESSEQTLRWFFSLEEDTETEEENSEES